jgi:hypothetical protein
MSTSASRCVSGPARVGRPGRQPAGSLRCPRPAAAPYQLHQTCDPSLTPALAAASTTGTFRSSSNNTYTYYSQFVTQSAAERICQDAGGHLAAFNTIAEQKEVEAYYIAQGLLLTDYHKRYWLGLSNNRGAWTWLDKAIQGARAALGLQRKPQQLALRGSSLCSCTTF